MRILIGLALLAAIQISCGSSSSSANGGPGGSTSTGGVGGTSGTGAQAGAGGTAADDGSVAPNEVCPMGPPPNLPSDSPRILLIAPASLLPDLIVNHLQGLFAGDKAFAAPEVVLQLTDTSTDYASVSLMGFWYSPGGRDVRLAPLAGPFTWVVLLDDTGIALSYPELHFEGVRVVACRARAAGAKPILLQTWTVQATDTAARGEIAYRVGNGTGTPVVPAGYVWEAALPTATGSDAGAQIPAPPKQTSASAFVAAASLYSAITGKSAATTSYQPSDIAAQQAKLAEAAQNAVQSHAAITHYTTPFASVVQLRTIQPQPELWFMTSGTSSEALWFDRMNEIVPKLGMTPKGTAIGVCNATKTFDTACLDTAVTSFASSQYRILLARDYSVSAATTSSAGKQDDLQVEVWDRQFDQDPADGAAAVAALEVRSISVSSEARSLGLAWIPYHLMFAKLKTARPSVQLSSDGTHATYPVSYGLAAMSVVSRTSSEVPTSGLDDDTAAAVGFANETIRQLSSLSQSGTYVADDPTTRPKVQ